VPAKYQTIDDVATLVQHRGPTTLPGAPPDISASRVVVCLHDAGMGGSSFGALMDELEATTCPLAFDLPGHGRSGGLDSLASIADMADHARALLRGFAMEGVIVVGEGMGVAVAIELAAAEPTPVAGLVLVGGAADSWDLDDEIASLAAIAAGRARREFDRSGYAPDTDRSVYQQAFGVWVKTDPRAAVGARRAQAAWSLGDRAGSITAPTVVVVGQHEEAASVEAARALAGRLPNASVATLDGAGRRGVLEQPAGLAGIVTDLNRELDR
jgi:3-oxoadipate enol-lactonase